MTNEEFMSYLAQSRAKTEQQARDSLNSQNIYHPQGDSSMLGGLMPTNLIGGLFGGGSKASTPSSNGTDASVQGEGGAGKKAGFLSGIMSLFSDKRLKKSIKPMNAKKFLESMSSKEIYKRVKGSK